MRLYLIRHGETVDNVANLYAGSRDSDLTNHGFQQASRLGEFFRTTEVQLTHVFSSHLKRAVKTAEALRKAQPVVRDETGEVIQPVVEQLPHLAEQDFGSYEGVSFLTRVVGSNISGKEAHRALHKDDPGFVDVESKESMVQRVDLFLDNDLLPIVQTESTRTLTIAVVSHGITLSVLWRRLLQRLPPKSVNVHPEVFSTYPKVDLERLGGWSNTGYLELDLTVVMHSPIATPKKAGPVLVEDEAETADSIKVVNDSMIVLPDSVSSAKPENPLVLSGWTVTICSINSRKHLSGLKRTGGGVGSSRHDDKQRSIETFFKQRKIG